METHLFCGQSVSVNATFFIDQKVKGQDHNVYVGLQIELNIAAAAYISHAGFSLL